MIVGAICKDGPSFSGVVVMPSLWRSRAVTQEDGRINLQSRRIRLASSRWQRFPAKPSSAAKGKRSQPLSPGTACQAFGANVGACIDGNSLQMESIESIRFQVFPTKSREPRIIGDDTGHFRRSVSESADHSVKRPCETASQTANQSCGQDQGPRQSGALPLCINYQGACLECRE